MKQSALNKFIEAVLTAVINEKLAVFLDKFGSSEENYRPEVENTH